MPRSTTCHPPSHARTHESPATSGGSDETTTNDDAGVISLFVVVAVLALMLAIGLVVDGGRKVEALQRADAIAEQAARTGSQQIVAAPSVRGEAPRLDAGAAQRAAQEYIEQASADTDGTSQQVSGEGSADGASVTVTVTVSESTVFLGALGIDTVSATAHSTARLVRGLDQEVP